MIYNMPWCCAECAETECERHYSNVVLEKLYVVMDYSVCCIKYRPKEDPNETD